MAIKIGPICHQAQCEVSYKYNANYSALSPAERLKGFGLLGHQNVVVVKSNFTAR